MGFSDKDLAVLYKADAGQYMIAAEELRIDEHSIHLVAPTYFLRSHAIELLLKACLLANGWSEKKCKALNHKLAAAMNEAEAVGLVLSDETKNVVRRLSPCHDNHTFRYRRDEPYKLPNAEAATLAVKELFDRVHAIVKAECLQPSPSATAVP
jgi:hypothetical protein